MSCTRTMGVAEQESDNGKKNDHTKNHVDVANCCCLGRQWSPIVVGNAGPSTFGDQRYQCHAIVHQGVVTWRQHVVWPTLLFKGHLTMGALLVGWTQGANEQVATCHTLCLSLPMSLPDHPPDCLVDSPHLVLPVNQMPSPTHLLINIFIIYSLFILIYIILLLFYKYIVVINSHFQWFVTNCYMVTELWIYLMGST